MKSFDLLVQRFYQLVGRTFTHVPGLARRWGRRFDALKFEDVPFTPMWKPLHKAKIALITTGGVHLRSQPAFDMRDPRGDATFRVIPPETPLSDLTITHDYYDHRDADRDMNILFPVELFQRLVQAGFVGGLGTSFGFMGHIEPPHLETLLHQTGPQVAGMLKQERIDAVLLTPA